jgi:cadmium resistance protein CadD (predicted permease)
VLALLGGAIVAFTVTNLDTFVVLTALFSARPRQTWRIVVGQYLGLAVLVAASGAAAIGLVAIPTRWIGLFGVVPLALGVRGLITPQRHTDAPARITLSTVATLVIANGADNLSVYTPLFRRVGIVGTSIYVAAFVILAGIWCIAASLVANRKVVLAAFERWEAVIIPAIFIVVGAALILTTVRA